MTNLLGHGLGTCSYAIKEYRFSYIRSKAHCLRMGVDVAQSMKVDKEQSQRHDVVSMDFAVATLGHAVIVCVDVW